MRKQSLLPHALGGPGASWRGRLQELLSSSRASWKTSSASPRRQTSKHARHSKLRAGTPDNRLPSIDGQHHVIAHVDRCIALWISEESPLLFGAGKQIRSPLVDGPPAAVSPHPDGLFGQLHRAIAVQRQRLTVRGRCRRCRCRRRRSQRGPRSRSCCHGWRDRQCGANRRCIRHGRQRAAVRRRHGDILRTGGHYLRGSHTGGTIDISGHNLQRPGPHAA